MKLWLDAQLSPHLAQWLESSFGLETWSARRLGLRDATDREIFAAARRAEAVVITKDYDFVEMLHRHGPPPKVLWLTCGNTSNRALKALFEQRLRRALEMLQASESLVEIRD